jgi:signal transduction histidine kinase
MMVEVKNANIEGPIPPAAMRVLFEPFERGELGDLGGASRARGLGLGLYIVEQIIHGHRGRIEVRSTERDGTTFTVHLPRAAATSS